MALQVTLRAEEIFHLFFFSGNPNASKNHTNAGVAMVISDELSNCVEDIEPISDRLMYITFWHTVPITFINVYMPTAEY